MSNKENNMSLIEKLEKTTIFPPNLKNFLIIATEEGALEKDLEKELEDIINKNKKI